jgi:hypothetical protein
MDKQLYAVPNGPKETQKFRLGMWVSIALVLLFACIALFAPPQNRTQMPALLGLILFCGMSALFWRWMIGNSNTYLEVTDDEIIHSKPNETPISLAWEEISEVTNNLLDQSLELRAHSKGAVIKVSCQTRDYNDLCRTIAERTGINVASLT